MIKRVWGRGGELSKCPAHGTIRERKAVGHKLLKSVMGGWKGMQGLVFF